LKLLAKALPAHLQTDGQDELSRFYDELWREEATHHLLFIELAERTLTRSGLKADKAFFDSLYDE
jgi:tRNA isopentenyl-2-thiomethyl-A-37 hydroxylase MiaE